MRISLIAALFLFWFQPLSAQNPKYEILPDGVVIYPSKNNSGGFQAVRIKVYNDQIIRVTATPQAQFSSAKSLSVIQDPPASPEFKLTASGENLRMETKTLTVQANLLTGSLGFFDPEGHPILEEQQRQGRLAEALVKEGIRTYRLVQHFLSTPEDAYYGLGQHQDDVWNYKGRKTIFFQNNSEVAVPFLVSTKNYGILWDNYAYGEAGDIRPLSPLSHLQLYNKKGEPGWLTATYFNNKDENTPLFEKAESEINYPYLNDLLQRMPKEFKPANGKIVWEGSISSAFAGRYQFRFTYGGYLKAFINGKLIFDKWRQAWNPGTALADLSMEANQKYSFKLEWIPDGGESYVSAHFLPPPTQEEENRFSFLAQAGQEIDYYFIQGKNADEVIRGYRYLTGKAPIVPKWAMGYWQSRERYKSQEEVLNTVAEFRKRKFPLDNIVQDWFYWKENEWGSQQFDTTRFPDAAALIKTLHEKYKTQFMISVWPKFYEGIPNYDWFWKKGWLYSRNIADRQKDWVGPGYISTFYDVFNPEARQGFWSLLNNNLFKKGVDAWWMDASEPDILSNVSPEKRIQQMQPLALGTASEYMNAYPLLNAKGIYEGQRATDSNKRVFLLTRSAFTGSQRFAASIWSGDIGARWEDMRTQITAGMNYSLSGLPYWTLDIGGFATETRYNKIPMDPADEDEWRELQTRWYQFGSFLPLFRSHGQFPFREPFHIAPENHPAYQSMLFYNQLRYRLMPYHYSLAGAAYHQDYTLLRGLVMDFSADKNTWTVDDQFMYGNSFLVNPVYQYKARERSLYLPGGCGWYDLYTGQYEAGGQRIRVKADPGRMPVFVKEGSIIPTGPDLQYAMEKKADPLVIYVYTGKDASFTLYEDEGVNYNYEKGLFAEIRFVYEENSRRLRIEDRKGSFPGVLKNRTLYIQVIDKDKPAAFDFSTRGARKIKYKGKEITIQL